MRIASVIALLAFAAIAAGVEYWLSVAQLDRTIADGLHAHALTSQPTVDAMNGITWWGTHRAYIGISLAVMAVAIVFKQWRFAVVWAIIQVIGGALIQQTKLFFGRPRPQYNGFFATEDSYSFPSGHALSAIVGYGMLAYVLVLVLPTRLLRSAAIIVCTLVALAIGFSRIYLGVHWFSDVMAGYALGFAWLLLAVSLIEDVRRTRSTHGKSQ